jgi:uncharacterized protein YdhG (YjbR/CyaY superfamily)
MGAPKTVEQYLAAVPQAHRAALQKLRATIKAAAPGATEAISYQIPTIKVDGRAVVAFAAFKDHCSLFPMSLKVVNDHLDELRPHLSGRSTIRFAPNRPLPAKLVRAIVKERLAENAARKRSSKTTASTKPRSASGSRSRSRTTSKSRSRTVSKARSGTSARKARRS